jgi:alginate O-acetyltransferase complex protein AlgI
MFGFHLPENFNYPYVAQSMTDFWRRWHITLVSWFRDYLFYPMSYRRPAWRIHLNLFIVFLLCGLWHEGSWKFVFWGALHGSILALERVGLGRQLLKLPRVVRHLYVILMIIGSCVFVRATSFPDALRFLARMIGVGAARGEGYGLGAYMNRPLIFALAVGVVGCLPLLPKLRGWLEVFANDLAGFRRNLLDTGVGLFKMTMLTVIFLASVSLSAAGTYNAFIYFNF